MTKKSADSELWGPAPDLLHSSQGYAFPHIRPSARLPLSFHSFLCPPLFITGGFSPPSFVRCKVASIVLAL